jgi:polar amino acid transport system substrate-binding protein
MNGRLAVLLAAVLLLLSFGCAKQQACAAGAQLCPDGSFVARNASLGCDFDPCQQPPVPGGDVDAHGCIPSAGYSWCEPLQKCIRPWEEVCSQADLEATARNLCRQPNVAQVSVCGPYIKSVSSLDGAGSTFYTANGSEINCPLVAPDYMSEECRLLFFGNNCIEQTVCSPSSIRILTEDFAPFNYRGEDGAVAGQSTDMVREMLYRNNETAEIELMDWPSAYNISLSSPNSMLYSVARTPERESLFSWVGPIGSYEKVFYAKEGTGLSITGLAQAKSAGKICVVKDSARHQFLSDSNISDLLLAQSDSECARQLVFGQALMWLASSDGYARAAQEAGISPDTFVQEYVADTTDLYLAFNKGVPNEAVQEWASALAATKSDGTYKQILLKYSPSATAGSVVVRKLQGCKNVAGPGIDSICEIFHPSRIGSDAAVYYSIAHATLAPGQKVSAHAMMNAEVVYVLNGQGTLSIDGKEYQVSRDYVVQIPASATQSLSNTGSVPLLYLAINSPPWEAERQVDR